jgi:hypothetical protein
MNSLPQASADRVLQLADGSQQGRALAQDTADAAVLETAYDLLDFRGEQNSATAKALLEVRSRVAESAPSLSFVYEAPETGHASARTDAGVGRSNGSDYIALGIRPGFHDLVDDARGYIPGAEINVLQMHLRYFTDDDSLQLERLRFIDVVSLSPVLSWYTPLSWLMDFKLERTYLDADSTAVPLVLRGGAGFSTDAGVLKLYGLMIGDAEYSQRFNDDYTLLAGLQLGLLADMGFGQLHATVESDATVAGMDRDRESVDAQLQINLATNLAVRFGYRFQRYETFDVRDAYGRMQWYF